MKSSNGFPLNALNVPMKILNMSDKKEKKEVKKLIKGNVRGVNFIENLRENLGLKYEENPFKNQLNGNILSTQMIRKNFMKKK